MQLHDKLAQKAFLAGRTASEFHVAAQRKANATWLFLIAAGVVWYFVNWAWAIVPAVLAAFTGLHSVSATLIEARLEKLEALTKTPHR